jgi:hypothetical protein
MWSVYVAASNAGATDPPELARYASGDALSTLDKGLADNASKGLVTKGTPTIAPRVTASGPTDAPTSVTISDCSDGSRWLLYTKDGHLADNTPGGHHRVTATVIKGSSGWSVTSLAVQETGTC